MHIGTTAARADRQKTRLMWLVEDWGTDKFREMVGQQMGGVTLRKGVPEEVAGLLHVQAICQDFASPAVLVCMHQWPEAISMISPFSLARLKGLINVLGWCAQYDDVWERRDVLGVHPTEAGGLLLGGRLRAHGAHLRAGLLRLC